MLNILWILVQVISPVFAVIYGLALAPWRFSRRATILIAGISLAALTTANILIIMNLHPIKEQVPEMDFLYRIGNIFLTLIIALLLVDKKILRAPEYVVFGALSVCVCIHVVDTVAVTIRALFGLYPLELLCELLLYPLMLLLMIKMRKLFLETAMYLKKRLWPLCFVPAVLVVAIFMLISVPIPLEHNPGNIPMAIMMCAVAVGTYGTIFYLFNTIRIRSDLEQNAVAFRLYTSALEQQNDLVNRNAQKAAMFRHDLRHIAQLIRTCLDQNDADGVRELLGTLDRNVSETENPPVLPPLTGHKMIDAALVYYVGLGRETGIEMSVSIDPPDDVKTDKTELAVVVANALENAVYACEKVPDGEKREVRVTGHKQGKQYFLKIANTCAGEVQIDPETNLPTTDREGHGLGSQSIAFFVKNNGANMEYSQEGNWFYISLLIS